MSQSTSQPSHSNLGLPNVILVTGGAGFIGSNFIHHVLENSPGTIVLNVDALTYAGNLENFADLESNDSHRFVRMDICETDNIASLAREHGVGAIVNFAAESHVDRSILGPREFIRTNVEGTLSLLLVARELSRINPQFRFIQIGTDEVYGSLGRDGKFTESTPLDPHSPYSASKASADHLVQAFGTTYGLQTIITRCSNNYGPYQFPEKMIPLMINNARQDKPLPVYGNGQNVRDWIHVRDHCRAIAMVLKNGRPGQIYNIGADSERNNLQVVKSILQKMGKPESLIRYVEDRPGHDFRYAIDASKIRNEIGWSPSVQFEDGLTQTIDWYLSHRGWLDRVVSGEYQKYYESMYSLRPTSIKPQ